MKAPSVTVALVADFLNSFAPLALAAEWDNVGLLLRGAEKQDIERGQVLCKPGTITPHKKFKAEIYVLSKDEGGRHTQSDPATN